MKSVVLLKNNGALPLKNDLSYYYVTGPNAADAYALLGNYYGVNGNMSTFLEGIASAIKPGSQLQYKPGFLLDRENINPIDWTTGDAKQADATIVVMGITGLLEGEEGESISSATAGDRLDYNLPKNQINFLKTMRDGNTKPIIAVVTGGSPMNLSEVYELADAVILAWYPGEEGGNAVADIVFGKVSPSGKLPLTFPKSLDQLPPYEDYSLNGRTYRYFEQEPLFPFGFGLSYTKFEYSNLKFASEKIKKGQSAELEATVKNTGAVESEEVVQLYITDLEASVKAPLFSLKSFKRIKLKPGESTQVKFTVTPEMMSMVNKDGKSVVEPGKFKVAVGGSLPIKRSEDLGSTKATEGFFTVR